LGILSQGQKLTNTDVVVALSNMVMESVELTVELDMREERKKKNKR
jgi:hypothetical protein